MISQTLIPNIILTTNPDLASQFSDLTRQYTSFSKFLEDVRGSFSNDEYFVLTTENTSLTKFEFSFQGNQVESSPPKCVLEFIETKETFELQLLSSYTKRLFASNGEREIDGRVFYVAFGVSDDLSYWSKFQAVHLLGATVFQNFDNPKTVQLTFSIGVGYNTIFDALSSELIDDSVLSKLELNNRPYTGLIHGPNGETLAALTNNDDEFNANSDLLAKYLIGFNSFDALYKEAINGLLRALMPQQNANIFIVSDDLFKLSFNRLSSGTYAKDYNSFQEELSNKANALLRLKNSRAKNYRGSGSVRRATRQFFDNLASKVINVMDSELSTETTIANNFDVYADVMLAFRLEIEDDPTLSEKKIKLIKLLGILREGLKKLSLDQNIILVKEGDTEILKNFYNLFSSKAKVQLPLNPNLPIIMFGNEKIIRAMLYGETFGPNNETKSGEKLPINKASAAYLSADWLSKNLYGSHPKGEQVSDLANVLSDQLIKAIEPGLLDTNNFPIFRYNVKNPNVLGVTVDDLNAFFSLLQAGFTTIQTGVNEYTIELNNKKDLEEDLAASSAEFESLREGFRRAKAVKTTYIKSELRDALYASISDRFSNNNSVYRKRLKVDIENSSPSSIPSKQVSLDDKLVQTSERLKEAIEFTLNSDKTLKMLESVYKTHNEINKDPVFFQPGGSLRTSTSDSIPNVREALGLGRGGIPQGYNSLGSGRVNPSEDYGLKGKTRIFKATGYSLDGPYGALDATLDIQDIIAGELDINNQKTSDRAKLRASEIEEKLDEIFEDVIGISVPGLSEEDKRKFKLTYLTLLESLATAELVKAGGDETKLSPDIKALNNLLKTFGDIKAANDRDDQYVSDQYSGISNLKQQIADLNVTIKGIEDSLDSTRLYNDLIRAVDQHTMMVEITTLPFFNISNFFWIGYPCLLYANRPKLIGGAQEDVLDTLISGSYLIVGMKHTITPTTCESQFTLMKKGTSA